MFYSRIHSIKPHPPPPQKKTRDRADSLLFAASSQAGPCPALGRGRFGRRDGLSLLRPTDLTELPPGGLQGGDGMCFFWVGMGRFLVFLLVCSKVFCRFLVRSIEFMGRCCWLFAQRFSLGHFYFWCVRVWILRIGFGVERCFRSDVFMNEGFLRSL